MLFQLLHRLFEAHLVEDNRLPIHLLTVADVYRVGLLLPDPLFFLQIIAILILQMAIANALAVLCHYGIVLNHDWHLSNKQSQSLSLSSILSFLITFGIVIPLTTWTPFCLMDALDIRSTVMRMGLVALPICVQLSCLQAYFGYTPAIARQSLCNFRSHMGYLMIPKYNVVTGADEGTDTNHEGVPLPATRHSIQKALAAHCRYYMWNALLYSILSPLDYEPFASPNHEQLLWSFNLQHLCNNFVAAVLLSLSLCFSLSGVHVLVQFLGGFQCEPVVDNPLFSSSSPSDFWGRRWNRLVHAGLKNGIYKPVRAATTSRTISTLATFVASGVMHEYVWCVLFYRNIHQQDVYTPSFVGKSMLFFGWNGILLVLEYAIVGEVCYSPSWLQRQRPRSRLSTMLPTHIPKPIITLLVVLMALPVAHLFTGDMIAGGYFQTLEMALPMLVISRDGEWRSWSRSPLVGYC